MRATQKICKLNPKSKKNYRNKSTNQNEKFLKKNCVSYPKKWKGAKNLFRGYPTEFADSTQNPKKNYRNFKSTNQNVNLPKKYV
jgi:hypothetical protein